jgi:hypothetical protein
VASPGCDLWENDGLMGFKWDLNIFKLDLNGI